MLTMPPKPAASQKPMFTPSSVKGLLYRYFDRNDVDIDAAGNFTIDLGDYWTIDGLIGTGGNVIELAVVSSEPGKKKRFDRRARSPRDLATFFEERGIVKKKPAPVPSRKPSTRQSSAKKAVKTTGAFKNIVLLHGTSLNRAKNIKLYGFADTTTMDREMREGWGSVGEQGLTFFMRYFGIKDEKDRRGLEAGAIHHAYRVGRDDGDDPAVIIARARVNRLVTNADAGEFKVALKRLCARKMADGDDRYFRDYSIDKFEDVSSALASVATEKLPMGEIMREMDIDAMMDGPGVVMLANQSAVTSIEVKDPSFFEASIGFKPRDW